MRRSDRKLDLAARAAWLYYVASNTQDEIAAKLNVSRQAAQRLVSLANAEKLIRHSLNHPLAECIELAETLRARYALASCEVAPSDPEPKDPLASLGEWAAAHLEGYLASRIPTVVALSAGRALRAMVNHVTPMNQPQHKIVALQGHMAPDGRASHYEVVMNLADRINAQAYLLPTPVVARSAAERAILQEQTSFRAVQDLARQAKVAFVGIGEVTWNGPLQIDGFYGDAEVAELIKLEAVGAILAWAYDREGRLVQGSINDRVAGMSLSQLPVGHTIGVACGAGKVEAICAALRGKLVSGLITDEVTARLVLERSG
jgi:DNA-binding transcriptional regulator LsrR (DeoR family)